jgi:signal transduction histidine kinase
VDLASRIDPIIASGAGCEEALRGPVHRAIILYTAAILVPGAILAGVAFRLAGRERLEALRALDNRVADEASRLGRSAERAIENAVDEAEKRIEAAKTHAAAVGERPVVYLPAEGEIRYHLQSEGEPSPPDPEESRYFRLSREGGESFEFKLGDPGRALDAYSFYVPRIRSPRLRALLRHRIARVAAADGRTALAASILRELVRDARTLTTAEGLPLDIIAGERLLALGTHDEDAVRETLRARLRRGHQRLSTPLLRYFARRLTPDDPELARIIAARKLLEQSIAAHRATLEETGFALAGEYRELLLVVHATAGGERAVTSAAIAWPPLELAGSRFTASVVSPVTPTPSAEPGVSTYPLTAGPAGPLLAVLRVRDLGYEAARQRIVHLWRLGCALIGLTIAVTLAGAFALLRFLRKERRLARLRTRLVANVSHELKSPVTSIRMFSDMLAEDPLDESRTRRFGRLLRAESQRLSQLIENLLDFSRLGREEVAIEFEPVDVAAVLHRVAEGFGYRAREKNVRFDIELPSPADRAGRGGLVTITNAQAVERITLNLLDNALKYRRAQAPQICLAARQEGRRITVSVADNGSGIAGAEQDRIFEEFYRGNYDDYAVRGSGLGLALARRLARRMGGDVTVESRVGAGSTFSLELPVREYPDEGGGS